eukprot:PhF_6_TR468/c0_g1_i2/m.206
MASVSFPPGTLVEVLYEEEVPVSTTSGNSTGSSGPPAVKWVPCRQMASVISCTATHVTVRFADSPTSPPYQTPISTVRALPVGAQAPPSSSGGNNNEPEVPVANALPEGMSPGLAGGAELWLGGVLDGLVTFLISAVMMMTGGAKVKCLLLLVSWWYLVPVHQVVWAFVALCIIGRKSDGPSSGTPVGEMTTQTAFGSYVHSVNRIGTWGNAICKSTGFTMSITSLLVVCGFLRLPVMPVVGSVLLA